MLPFMMVVVFASSAFVQEHLGVLAIVAHFFLVLAAFMLARKLSVSVPARWTPWLILGLFAGLAAIFFVVYPIEHGRGPGRSSDRDDALNIAVARILDGESPYYPQSDRAGPLSLFPGAILLALPFAVAGNSAWQNFLWLAILLFVTARLWRSREAALFSLAALLSVSPAVQYEFISGGDMLANSIYVPCAALFLLLACSDPDDSIWLRMAAAAFFGLALTSRPNFAFIFPLVMAGVVTRRGWVSAFILGGISVAVACVLTLPIYLRDPMGFTPLPTGNKVAYLDAFLPHASWWLAGVTSVLSIIGGWSILRRPANETLVIWRWCAIILLVPMAGAVLLQSLSEGGLSFMFLHDRYGLMPMIFAFWAWLALPRAGEETTLSIPR
jgi:hypothetical protein